MLNKKGAIIMETFEPSAKAITLRKYAELYETRVEEPQNRLTATSWMLQGVADVFLALGGTKKELEDVRAIAWKIKGYEEEKSMQR